MTISERDAACRGQREDRAQARASMEVGPGASSTCAGVTSVGHGVGTSEANRMRSLLMGARERERESECRVGDTHARSRTEACDVLGRPQTMPTSGTECRETCGRFVADTGCVGAVCDVWASAWTHTSMTCGPRDEVLCSSRTCCVVQRRRNGGPLREREVYNYVTAAVPRVQRRAVPHAASLADRRPVPRLPTRLPGE